MVSMEVGGFLQLSRSYAHRIKARGAPKQLYLLDGAAR